MTVRVKAGVDLRSGEVAQRCGVSIVPAQVLSADGAHADRLRLPFVAEAPVLEEAVRRLEGAWGLYSGGAVAAEAPATVIV